MNLVDFIILLIVVLILGLIVYFRWIKKDQNSANCHCYKAKTCQLKIEDLKNIILDEE